jgi:hypothetical protein
MSTAILPDEPYVNFGQSTEMNLAAVLKRIEQRLQALSLSDNRASELAKKPDAIRNIRRALKQGRKGVNAGTLVALAPVLQVTPAWLMSGDNNEAFDHVERGDLETLRAKRLVLLRQLQHLDYSISILEQAYKPAKTRKKARGR